MMSEPSALSVADDKDKTVPSRNLKILLTLLTVPVILISNGTVNKFMEVIIMNDELYEKLAQLQWLLHKNQMRSWAQGGPLRDHTRGQGRILAFLRLRDGISTKDLSYLLGMAVSSLNEMLAKLEKGGYITREPSEADKRIMLVKLTEKGKIEDQPETPDMADIFAGLSEEEQKTFGDYLDRIIASMEKYFSETGDETFERKREAHERFGYEFHRQMGKEIPKHFFEHGRMHGAHGFDRQEGHERFGHEFHHQRGGNKSRNFVEHDKWNESDGGNKE